MKYRQYISLLITLMIILSSVVGQEGERLERSRLSSDIDLRTKRLYDQAIELMEYKQYDRGLEMLGSIVRDHQGTMLAHMAHMAIGKHYLEQRKHKECLSHFMLLTRLLAPVVGETQKPEEIELYNESLFQAGLANYQSGQYSAGFPLFRRLTEVAGKTKWANMAYFYIGMSHYKLENWNKAIDSLSLVGTEVSDDGKNTKDKENELGRIEIGQRFYAKIEDADIPIMRKLGQPVEAFVEVSSGDREKIVGAPVPGKKLEMLASAPTELGSPIQNDGKIQLIGGDILTVTYMDDSTLAGEKGVSRKGKVRAVSTGTVGFYLGDYSTPAYIAYPGQPQVVMLRDADLDKTPRAETVSLTISSRFKVEAKEAAETDDLLDIFALEDEEQDAWKERDRITITLEERLQAGSTSTSIRTGIFAGKIKLEPVREGVEPESDDAILHTDELDELHVTYTDEVHLYGNDPRESDSRIKVSGSVNSGVTADQYVVYEELLKARKASVEAEALIGLGEIYKDMGLDQRATLRAKEALSKVDPIIINRKKLPSNIVENAFRLKWEGELIKDDFTAATTTCLAFNRLYPESVLADQALMTLGRSLVDRGDFEQAVSVYGRVLQLENPISGAEAQFRIGEALQKQAQDKIESEDAHNSKWGKAGLSKATALQNAMGGAIAAYRKTYQNYPESSFAADALGRVVRHYVDTEAFAQAADLLESVFNEYPDAEFLDEMLMLWAKVAYRMGDLAMAQTKLRQLIFDYPTSSQAGEARKMLSGLKSESK
jgi:TolA-binding protein